MESFESDAPKSNRIVPAVTAAVLVSALVAGSGVYAYQRRQADSQKNDLQAQIDTLKNQVEESKAVMATSTPLPTAMASATPTSSPASDATANWKTYRNNELGFTIKHPSNLEVKFFSDSNTVSFSEAGGSRPGVIAVSVNSSTKTLDQFLADLKDGKLVSGEVKTTLDSKAAYEGVDQGLTNQYGIYSVSNGKEFRLLVPTNGKDALSDLKGGMSSTQQLMVGSFRFLN
jgi:outer membrane murein-binding lipoprotein Lpp